jgi:hypothetical protein
MWNFVAAAKLRSGRAKRPAVKFACAPQAGGRRLRAARIVLGVNMASQRPPKTTKPLLTMHDWEAKHYLLAAVIILVVMGMFAYSWS